MRFFNTLQSLSSASLSFADPFVVQWEIPEPRDNRERMYIVFDGMEEYEKCLVQGRYTTCHEVFISPNYDSSEEVMGHPAFDFDCKPETSNSSISVDVSTLLPPDWRIQLQNAIIASLCTQYPSHEDELRVLLSNPYNWVWMTSPSKDKISAHLTIRCILFPTWR